MTKIIKSVAVIAFVAAIAVGATSAYFSDTATVTGSTFSAGTLDLKIDSDPSPSGQTWSDGFASPIVLANLAPGFAGEQIVDIKKIGTIDGMASVRLVVTSNKENTLLPLESAIGDNEAGDSNWNGELANNIRVKISYAPNNTDFGSVLYDYTLAEFNANSNQLPLGALSGSDKIASIKFEYSIPNSVGNNIMTDSVTVDTIFGLEQNH